MSKRTFVKVIDRIDKTITQNLIFDTKAEWKAFQLGLEFSHNDIIEVVEEKLDRPDGSYPCTIRKQESSPNTKNKNDLENT